MAGRRVLLIALAAALACVLPGCGSSKYEFASNKRLGVYLKVPNAWHSFDQNELLPLYAEGDEQPSPEAFQILKQLMWERAWDSSRSARPTGKPRSVKNFLLGEADAPVVRVAVRALTVEQQQTMSITTLSNLTLGAYDENLQGFKELLRNPGTSDLVGADFVPIQDEELRPGPKSGVRAGFSGVRQLFEARDPSDKSLYMIAFIGVMDDARTRIYTLTMHCNRTCYVENEKAFTNVLDSFTVRKL